jgi:hypothetical protein
VERFSHGGLFRSTTPIYPEWVDPEEAEEEEQPWHIYLRFFPDGIIRFCHTPDTPGEIAPLFQRDLIRTEWRGYLLEHVYDLRCTLETASVKFLLDRETLRYLGIVKGDHLKFVVQPEKGDHRHEEYRWIGVRGCDSDQETWGPGSPGAPSHT